VRISEVDLPVEVSPALETGAPVDLAIRPENIRLRNKAAGNTIAGLIREKTFLGNLAEYWVELPGNQSLRVQTHPIEAFEIGSAVYAEIDTGECSVFRRTAA
jgi:iron(III) transport system ATP-binding protein